MRAALESAARKTGIAENVTFTGALPRSETLAYLRAADAFVLNTAYEGFAHFVLEAAAFGTPIATTDIPGNAEFLKDGESALLFSVGDTEAIVRTITRIHNDSALGARLARAAEEIPKNSPANDCSRKQKRLCARLCDNIYTMRVLMISTDNLAFGETNDTRLRFESYAKAIGEVHFIVVSREHRETIQIEGGSAIVCASGKLRVWGLLRAYMIGSRMKGVDVVSAQDPFEQGFIGWLIARRLKAGLHIQVHTDIGSPYFTENSKNKIRVYIARFLCRALMQFARFPSG